MNCDSENVQETMQKVSGLGKMFIVNLLGKWNSMYLMNDDMWKQGEQIILANIQEFFDEILLTEEGKKKILSERVQNRLTECRKLQSILKLSPLVQVDSDEPLSVILDDLKVKLEEIEVLKQERMAHFEQLRSKEINLCNALTEELVPVSMSIPSEEEMEKIDLHIFQLEEEKIKRFEIYSQCRKDIEKLITSLEVTTLNQLEQDLISGEDPAFPLTADSMAELNEIKEKYLKNAQENESLINGLKQRLQKLWDRLDVPQEQQIKFLTPLKGIGCSVKNKLFAEISKCQDRRLAMLAPLADKVREEIVGFCDELTYTDDQKASLLMIEKAVTEELLDLLEQKCEELNVTLNNCRHILCVTKKRRALWERMEHLEKASQDKSRLFTNRGGQLLKEEKERKAIDQALPKLQHELVQLLIKYQEENGTPFLYYGNNLLEMINAEWQARVADKENYKGKKRDNIKRKRDAPDSASKRTRVDSQDSLIASSNFPASSKTASSTSSRSRRSKGNTSDKNVFVPTVFTYEGMSSSLSSYSMFQEAMAVGGLATAGAPAAHSSPTDRRGTFTVGPINNLPNTPYTPGRTLRSTRTPISALPRPRTPRHPVLRSAAAGILSAPPPRPRTPGTPRPRPCALTLPRTPSTLRQNNNYRSNL